MNTSCKERRDGQNKGKSTGEASALNAKRDHVKLTVRRGAHRYSFSSANYLVYMRVSHEAVRIMPFLPVYVHSQSRCCCRKGVIPPLYNLEDHPKSRVR
jgi:hypothetical protein